MYVSKYTINYDLDREHALLANSLTGAVDLLDAKTMGSWLAITNGNKDGNNIDEELKNCLLERGYIYPSVIGEKRLFKELTTSFQSSLFTQPLRFVICPTYQCNLECKYCYEGQLPQSSTTTLTDQSIKALFRSIKHITNSRDTEQVTIELSGGEPLLLRNKALIEEIFVESSRQKYKIGVVTNGVDLASHFSGLFLKHKELISFMQITLDGPREIHNIRRPFRGGQGTFDKIVASIDSLLINNFPVRIRVNIDAQNIPYLAELTEFMRLKGWVSNPSFQCHLAPVLDHRNNGSYPYLLDEISLLQATEHLNWLDNSNNVFQSHLFRVLQHISSVIKGGSGTPSPCLQYCEANSPNFFIFGADGLIYACGEAIGNPQFAIGSFLPAFELWSEKEQLWRNRSIASIPECHECNIAGFCGGGCTFSAMAQYGSPNIGICGQSHDILHYYCEKIGRELCNYSTENIEQRILEEVQ